MALNLEIVTVGIDMGGTKIAAAPFVNGKLILEEKIIEPTPQNDPQGILSIIANMVSKIQEKYEVRAVGVSTAGVVDNQGTMIGGCGNIKGWKGTKVKKELEALLRMPVVVENDANCAALAESVVGCAANFNPVLLVIVGTGIGGGLIYEHKVWRGAHFSGGEIGHIKISDAKARHCTCGAWDCWESYASGNGLQITSHLLFADPKMDNYKLMQLHQQGDDTAIQVLNTWHEYLALGMASVINSFDPDIVVVSGGMAKFIDYPKLNNKVKDKVVDSIKNYVRIVEGTLGNDSGMIGAACLANLELPVIV